MAAKVLQSPAELKPYRRILLFGGSFDPPHTAHVSLPRQVRAQLDDEVVVYIPAAQSPHKLDRQPTPAHHRLAMLQAALAEHPDALILTLELDRASADKPSYTVDTLEQLRAALSEDTVLHLLIGADQVPVFDKWHAADRIQALAEPIAMVRPPETKASLLAQLSQTDRQRWSKRIVEVPAMDVSATDIRQRLSSAQPVDDLVPGGVARYIAEHGLYQNSRESESGS
jgi:nicotinate-nucleotide adenylyltransferase